jgi:hypothetical protein
MLTAALSGLVAGLVHVWSGPDHLTAVAPLAVRQPVRSWVPGLRWGLGHSSGVAVIGVLSLLLRQLLPLEWLSAWGERLVGFMLIGIGFWGLRKALEKTVHVHEHDHGGDRHIHIHAHAPRSHHDAAGAHRHTHAAMGIGILHGLAGSSHLLGILPMLAFPTATQALCYLCAFGAGTVISMAGFSWAMGLAARRCAKRGLELYRGLMITCGTAAMIVGCFWIAQTFGTRP